MQASHLFVLCHSLVSFELVDNVLSISTKK